MTEGSDILEALEQGERQRENSNAQLLQGLETISGDVRQLAGAIATGHGGALLWVGIVASWVLILIVAASVLAMYQRVSFEASADRERIAGMFEEVDTQIQALDRLRKEIVDRVELNVSQTEANIREARGWQGAYDLRTSAENASQTERIRALERSLGLSNGG